MVEKRKTSARLKGVNIFYWVKMPNMLVNMAHRDYAGNKKVSIFACIFGNLCRRVKLTINYQL